MSPQNWQEWIAWAGIVLPLATLAGSAAIYVAEQRRKNRQEEFERFFSIMDKIGLPEGSILSKIAAVRELRKFPQYSELIVRVCEDAKSRVVGSNAEMLAREFRLTAEFMKHTHA